MISGPARGTGVCEESTPPERDTVNLRTSTKIMNFRGFDSGIVLNFRGGIPRPIGNFPESLSRAIVGIKVSREVGHTPLPRLPLDWPLPSPFPLPLGPLLPLLYASIYIYIYIYLSIYIYKLIII